MKTIDAIKAAVFSGVIIFFGIIHIDHAALAQGSKTFNNPMIRGYRLDWCLHWGKQCGKPAANAWCAKKMGKADGYAISWKQATNIGASTPTYVLGDKKVCGQQFCDGFQWIKCGFSLD